MSSAPARQAAAWTDPAPANTAGSGTGTDRPGRQSLRCAVYTRKSSEEGLDQAFNSLDAQREAGMDYIKSQRHQGWFALPETYDDGGFSGGSTDRPGLQRLLADIRHGRIDVVVVYKVDRLSRSLADFAQLMRLFDEHRVSFVSVTQQFSTTSSMGRLTLNMLLSFAQFEREVAGERIRDKIAATKRRGVWVCGQPPLGYRLPAPADAEPANRVLRVVPQEAELIQTIYGGYLRLRSPIELARELARGGHTSKRWKSSRGADHGGKPITPGQIYRVLTNPVYIGKLTHTRGGTTTVIDALHEPIISRDLWDRVQDAMAVADRDATIRWTHTHLLKGKLRTSGGSAMSPSSVKRSARRAGSLEQDARIRYYVSQRAIKHGYGSCPIRSINATHLDGLVRGVVSGYLAKTEGIDLSRLDILERDGWFRRMIEAVRLDLDWITVELGAPVVDELRRAMTSIGPATANRGACGLAATTLSTEPARFERVDDRVVLTLDVQIKRVDGRRVVISPNGKRLVTPVNSAGQALPDANLVRAVGQAYAWMEELLKTRATIRSVAVRDGVTDSYVNRMLTLTRLSPGVLRDALAGSVSAGVGVAELLEAAGDLDWVKQGERTLGRLLLRALTKPTRGDH